MSNLVKTKQDICNEIGISTSTLQMYLNNKWFSELQKIGYIKTQKILTAQQVKFIYSKLCYIPETIESK